MSTKLWKMNGEVPTEESRVYIKKTSGEIFIGVFNCKYCGCFEMQTLDREDDVFILVCDIEMWAYVDDLEILANTPPPEDKFKEQMRKYLRVSKEFGKVDSEYTRGLVNGIELALAYLEGRNAVFIKDEIKKEPSPSMIEAAPKMYEALKILQELGGLGYMKHAMIEKVLKEARGEENGNPE